MCQNGAVFISQIGDYIGSSAAKESTCNAGDPGLILRFLGVDLSKGQMLTKNLFASEVKHRCSTSLRWQYHENSIHSASRTDFEFSVIIKHFAVFPRIEEDSHF